MISKNLRVLRIIPLLFFINSAFASERYSETVQKHSEEIKELTKRLDKLEHIVNSMQQKREEHEIKRNIAAESASQEALKQLEPEKKVFVKEKNIDEVKSEYDTALALLKDGNFDKAEEKFANFIQIRKNHALRGNAIFWYAESFYLRNNFNQAAINYLKCYKEYPKGSKASDALLKLSLSLGALDKNKEACAILDKLESEFPKSAPGALKKAAEAKVNFRCKK